MEFHMSWNLCENGNHENQIEDEREGNVVCTDCGLILGPIYQYSIVNNDKKYVPHQNNKDKHIVTSILEDKKILNNLERETIELNTLCNKLQLYSVTKTQIFDKWEIIKKWVFDNKIKDRKKLHFKKGLIVMVIYQTLIELDIPRPMSHLCQDAGIMPKYVWYWIKLYQKNLNDEHKSTILKPTSMSEYFLKPLNLSYKEIQEINKLIESNDVLTYAPKTLITSCAYMFLRKENKKEYSVKKLANLLGVSVMSIYRCISALNNNAQRKT